MAEKNGSDDGRIFKDYEPLEDKAPYPTSGKSKQVRKSYPSDPVYKKRKKWWTEAGFGEDAAKWASSWRLGEPKKTRIRSDVEQQAVDNALRAADLRIANVARIQRKFPDKTKAEITKELDDMLRQRDWTKKHMKGLIEADVSIYDKSITPNIFLEAS